MTLKEKIEEIKAAQINQQMEHLNGLHVGALEMARLILSLRAAEQKGTFMSGKTVEAVKSKETLDEWRKEVLGE